MRYFISFSFDTFYGWGIDKSKQYQDLIRPEASKIADGVAKSSSRSSPDAGTEIIAFCRTKGSVINAHRLPTDVSGRCAFRVLITQLLTMWAKQYQNPSLS